MSNSTSKIRQELWVSGLHAARAYLADTYLSAGGIERQKSKADKTREGIVLEERTRAIWLAADRTYTEHHFRIRLLEEANTD